MAIRPPPKAPPLSVGPFELSGRIGAGILGSVYRGRVRETESLVTIHLVSPELSANQGVIDALREEFATAVQFEHPNILRLLDFGRESGFWYLVTEWVDGITLAQMIEAHSRLPEETAVRILTQIGQAVDYAHAVGYIHAPVRPVNVLIRNDGIAKLVAFEPALRHIDARAAATQLDRRTNGAAKEPSTPAEAFSRTLRSLGATLYEATTGMAWIDPGPPVPSSDKTGARKHRSRSSRPRPRVTGLSERVDLAVRWATDYDPVKQPISCAEWLKLLRSKSRAPATPRPDSRPESEHGDDRRASVRYAVGVGSSCKINTSVFDSDPRDQSDTTAVWPLVVRDVSTGGVGILLARRCEPGTELLIELMTESNQQTRSLPVRVVRVRRDTLGHWIHGCEFLSPLDPPSLSAVLEHLGRVDPS
jgi:eukaryotic-like serine/threonine-protein kinase